MNTTILERVLAYLVSKIPTSFIDNLNLSPNSVIGKWYYANYICTFPLESTIALKNRRIFGYGIRPEGKVLGYSETGGYTIEMTKDATGNFFDWMKTGTVPEDTQRITVIEKHFKWNIEHHFKLIK